MVHLYFNLQLQDSSALHRPIERGIPADIHDVSCRNEILGLPISEYYSILYCTVH
jgi:hypothetical protein